MTNLATKSFDLVFGSVSHSCVASHRGAVPGTMIAAIWHDYVQK